MGKEHGIAIVTALSCTCIYKTRKKLISDEDGPTSLVYGNKSMMLEFNAPFGAPKTSVGLQYNSCFLSSGTHGDGSLSKTLSDSP